MGRTSERIGVLILKPSRNTKKFCVRRPIRHQQHSAKIDRPFEEALQHHHMEEVVEGVHHKHSSLEQCHKHRQHGKSNKITLPQHSTTFGCRQVKSSSFGLKPVPCQRGTGSSGRKTKIVFRKLGKINLRCEYLSIVQVSEFLSPKPHFSFLPN